MGREADNGPARRLIGPGAGMKGVWVAGKGDVVSGVWTTMGGSPMVCSDRRAGSSTLPEEKGLETNKGLVVSNG